MSVPGQRAPEFSAKTVRGDTFTLSDHKGKVVVLFFFPSAYGPLCSREVADFAKAWRDFSDLGAEVIGISCDDEKTQCEFSNASKLPYALIADPEAKIVQLYDARWPLLDRVRRMTYVIDPDGIVRNVFRYELRYGQHSEKAMEATRQLRGTASPG
jgi:thioredoxin-dependent peroxiredoxin